MTLNDLDLRCALSLRSLSFLYTLFYVLSTVVASHYYYYYYYYYYLYNYYCYKCRFCVIILSVLILDCARFQRSL